MDLLKHVKVDQFWPKSQNDVFWRNKDNTWVDAIIIQWRHYCYYYSVPCKLFIIFFDVILFIGSIWTVYANLQQRRPSIRVRELYIAPCVFKRYCMGTRCVSGYDLTFLQLRSAFPPPGGGSNLPPAIYFNETWIFNCIFAVLLNNILPEGVSQCLDFDGNMHFCCV